MSTLDNLKKDAKRWLKALRAGEPSAWERLRNAYPNAPERPALRDVQHAVAREGGHDNWAALTRDVGSNRDVELLIDAGAPAALARAIVLDRREDLERIVREDPETLSNRLWARILVRASARASGDLLDRVIATVTRLRGGLTIVNYEADPGDGEDARVTPLHQAALHGNVDAIRVLLKHGASPRIRDGKRKETPAGWAIRAGKTDAANLLLASDVDLFDAIAADRPDVVSRVLDRDPGALDRPFRAYASIESQAGQWWPAPATTPLDWARTTKKTNAERVLAERGAGTRTPEQLRRAQRVVDFLQSACWDHHVHGKGDHRMYERAARRMLARDPAIATESLYTAIVCGEIDTVRRVLLEDPEAARRPGGARGWTPILYLAYTRFTHPPTIANAIDIARLLLDAGANPNDFYMAGDAQYSVLVGVAGEGEQDSPRQPYARELFELMLERGAAPFDMQVLYNTHFSGEILWWLDPVYRYTVDTPRGDAWKDPEWRMFDMGGYGSGARFILETAIKKHDRALAEWALARGANPNTAPPRDRRFSQRSLYELAVLEQQSDIAELLARHGAVRVEPHLDDEHEFIAACLRLDRERAEALMRAHPEYRAAPRPMFEAARRDRPDAIALLLDLGVPLEVQDATGKRALHEAAYANAVHAAAFLVERGAEIDPRESIYGGTPMGWASHGDRREVMDLLSRHTRAVWPLCFHGYIDRLAEVLREDPGLAKQLDAEGNTLLWWLPDDEGKAMAAVDVLLAAGVDPRHRNRNGNTAADWARRREMTDVAARLDASA